MTLNIRRQHTTVPRVTSDTIEEDSMCDRSHGDQTNINLLMERFKRSGEMPPGNNNPQFADVRALQGDLTDVIENGNNAAISAKSALDAADAAREQNQAPSDPPTDHPPAEPPAPSES
jgi:hypothetical protein